MKNRSKSNSANAKFRIVNVKEGMPTIEEARNLLKQEIASARQTGVKAMKIIHGYGSTGKGGVLKDAIRKSLSLRKKEGKISGFIIGEKWTIFNDEARKALESAGELHGDSDLEKCNEGITIVLL